ncbi:hypothetical protein [Nocardia acidivorans]|uniref:hypothetical protein n=1 Tax=Nocardia acidivorans TaxID=404580 RepID=UPI0012FA5451|nr:hypothetical protein [Nocardia acidivorans]
MIGFDNPDLLEAMEDNGLFDVEIVPETGKLLGSPAVALMLVDNRIGHLDPDVAVDMHPMIVRANSMGFAVKMRARMHPAGPAGRHLELRGTWPSHLDTWLSLPAELHRSEFFETEWARALWGAEFQPQRQGVLQDADQLYTECRVELCNGESAFDVYVSSTHVGTVSAGYSQDCENAVRRVESGQNGGYARLRRLDSGHIVVGVSIPEPGSTHIVQISSEPFLWPDERDAVERAQRERVARARAAGLVDGKDVRHWFEEVKSLKRSGRLEDAARLLTRMLDAEDAAATIIETPRTQWITEQAAIVFRKLGNYQAEVAVLRRYLTHYPPDRGPEKIIARLATARALLASPRTANRSSRSQAT